MRMWWREGMVVGATKAWAGNGLVSEDHAAGQAACGEHTDWTLFFPPCSAGLHKGLGFFSIQEKALFDTRYHYVSLHITLLSSCIIVYHCRRRHKMISMISMIHNARLDIP